MLSRSSSQCPARYNDTGTFDYHNRPGRHPLLNSSDRQCLKELVTDNNANYRSLSSKQLTTLWATRTGIEASLNTIRRNLKKVGLRSCVAQRKPAISAVNHAKRLQWAREHQHWTLRQWKTVMWTDETSISQFQQGRSCQVWRESHEAGHPKCISRTVKHSKKLIFSGAFSWGGLGPIVRLNSSVNGEAHVQTLQNYALPTLKKFFPRNNGILQEDNAPPHHSRKAAAVRKNIKVLPWPAQSPDLNPIEYLWKSVKEMVSKKQPRPTSLQMLERYVQEAWKGISPEEYRALVESMPHRVQAVIDAQGGNTKY